MPAAQVIDLSPTPNRSGQLFGEGFADRFTEKDRQRRNNDWFEQEMQGEDDPLKQAAKLAMSKHPLDPEYVKEKRKQLFENAEAFELLDKRQREQTARDKKKKTDLANLAFLEKEMNLAPGTLDDADPEFIGGYAKEKIKNKTKNNNEKAQKDALFTTYPNETSDIPKDSRDSLTPTDVQNHIKNKQKAPPKEPKTAQQMGQETFYKQQGKDAAEAVSNAKKKLGEIKGNKDTISELRDLNKKLKGPGGYAKILAGSEDASKFNALGHSLVKVPLSIFNPTGPVGVRKLEQLKEIYAITASERYGTVEGKLKAAEWMNELAEQAAKEQLKIYEKYNGFPPSEALEEFQKDFERAVIDPALEQSFQEGAEQMVGGFYSTDGKPLKPMPKSKAMDLLEKGLITHERQ